MPIVAEGGGDASEAIAKGLAENREEYALRVMNYWFEQSQLWLEQAASNRADIDSEGREGRYQNGLYAIQQQATPPYWDETEQAAAFSYNHEGAVFQEYGAKPHEIRARRAEVLAFEWPDAPDEVKEQFSHTEGDLVFFESINHPGIPAIGFTRRGRDKTKARLSQKGITVEDFES